MKIPIDVGVVWTRLKNIADKRILMPLCTYNSDYWTKAQFGKKRHEYQATMFGRGTKFYTGLIPLFEADGIEFEFTSNKLKDFKIPPEQKPNLNGVDLYSHQDKIILQAIRQQRGIIESPTASGKTITALAIMSAWPSLKWLFVVERKDLLSQTVDELRDKGFTNIGIVSEGHADPDRITVATIQTLVKYAETSFLQKFDGLICDECHHVAEETRYEKVFSRITAPIRIGMTGTLPPDERRMLALIGLFAPVIAKVEYQELQDAGLIAMPTIVLHDAPDVWLEDLNWNNAYSKGIVNNDRRNRDIASAVCETVTRKLTSLVMIKEIRQGNHLLKIMQESGLNCVFVHGGSLKDERTTVRHALSDRKYQSVICSSIWNEGINIPSLGAIFNAFGGSSEIKTIQIIGRGLRTTETKTEVEIHDWMDRGNRYLAAHSLDRIKTYIEKGWKIVYAENF